MTPPPRKPGAWRILDMFDQVVFAPRDTYIESWHDVLDAICSNQYDISGWRLCWVPNPADPTQKSAYEAGRFDSKWRFR